MAVPTTYADLRTDVDSLAGLDVTPDERDRFINEGNVALCTESGWTRDTLEFGPAVAGQTFYDLPAEFRKPATHLLEVGAQDYAASDREAVRKFDRGRTDFAAAGAWWIDYQGGIRKIGVKPIPAPGTTLQMLSVVTPPPLEEDDDEPPVPWDFRFAIVSYVGKIALVGPEDDFEGGQNHAADFARAVGRLEALRIEIESGDGPMQVGIQGVHW